MMMFACNRLNISFLYSLIPFLLVDKIPQQSRAKTGDQRRLRSVYPDSFILDSKDNGIINLDTKDHPWTLKSEDGKFLNIFVTIPGDILTDLEEAKVISDPYYEMNFLTQRRIWMGELPPDVSTLANEAVHKDYDIPGLEIRTRTWTYETNFSFFSTIQTSGDENVSVKNNNLRHQSLVSSAQRLLNETERENSESFHYSLIIEGIKMGASIQIDGQEIGNVTNQFKRYIFPIPNNNRMATHNLTISFPPDLDTRGRFMACSGGWDWAPYSNAGDYSLSSRRTFSFGIFKPIYIAKIYQVSIVHVVPKVSYRGLQNEARIPQNDFDLLVDVHLEIYGPGNSGGYILFRAPFFSHDKIVHIDEGRWDGDTRDLHRRTIVTLKETVKRKDIQLWWPIGLGSAHLYTIQVSYRNDEVGTKTSWVTKRIGFRTCALVTQKEDGLESKESTSEQEGTGSHGMYFRINGSIIWMRGANVIPASQFEGRTADEGYKILVESAAAVNMNMLRVWGGGMVLPELFYNRCDELGILIYHDMMFVEEQFHSPDFTIDIDEEIRFIVRSLSPHPSIVLYNGCNECERGGNITRDIYSQFVMKTVADEDDNRPIWPSSPSSTGWRTGVNTRDGTPNGRELSYWPLNDTCAKPIEIHGPYLHGSSLNISTVNGHPTSDKIYTQTPINISRSEIGPHLQNKFVSEFGASVYSSFESMSAFLDHNHWSIHGGTNQDNCTITYENLNKCSGTNVMAQRNYPCDSLITTYFGDNGNPDAVGEDAFRHQLYQCMISQALWMKGAIESMRNKNIYGLLIWQMNENWPTGGWGLIEYGSKKGEDGQVFGGRWKIIMHLLGQFLFRDVISTCGVDGICYCRNDSTTTFKGKVEIDSWDLKSGRVSRLFTKDVNISTGPGAIEYFSVLVPQERRRSEIVHVMRVINASSEIAMAENVILWSPPKALSGLARDAKISIVSITALAEDNKIEIVLETDKSILYVFLTTLEQGRFSENAFAMPAGTRKAVFFLPMSDGINLVGTDLLKSLKIDHLGMHLD